jgi:hypothetical protein
MTKFTINVHGYAVDLTAHEIDGEVSEVYATWNDQEIAFGYDFEDIIEKLDNFFKRWAL